MKNGFYRMLFSYLPLFFMITFILVAIFLLATAEQSRKQAAQVNDTFARYVMTAMEDVLRGIEQMVLMEMMKEDIAQLFFIPDQQEKDSLSLFKLSQRFNAITSNSLIDSMYVYLKKDKKVLSLNRYENVEDFGDKAFIDQWLDTDQPVAWTNERTYREFSSQGEERQVVSLVKPYPILAGDRGIIVVNISVYWLEQMLKKYESENGYVHLLDGNGKVITSNSVHMENAIRIHETEALVPSPLTGWSIKTGLSNGNLIRKTSTFSYIWVSLALLTFVFGTLSLIAITRRNYRPIAHIVERIGRFSVKKSSNDYHFIESALDDLLERTTAYQKKHEEDLIFKRQYLFQDLVDGVPRSDVKDWNRELKELGVFPESTQAGSSRIVIAVVEIDRFAQFSYVYTPRDQQLFKFVITSVIKELAEQQSISVWVEWVGMDRLGVILFLPDRLLSPVFAVRQLLEESQAWVDLQLDFTITAGVGSPAEDENGISLSYREAIKALSFKPSLGYNRVIGYWDLEDREVWNPYDLFRHIRKLAAAYRLREAEWSALLGELFQQLRNSLCTREDIVGLMMFLNDQLIREISEGPKELAEWWKAHVLSKLDTVLGKALSVDDLERDYRRVLEEALYAMGSSQGEHHQYHVLTEIKAYIDTAFRDPNMSLDDVSSRFDMSAKHLSRTFKEVFGEKFIDYLTRMRIDYAKRRIRDSNDSIQSIGIESGYPHIHTFIRVFKKLMGRTPGDYRKDIEN
ncbi:helix-turn-helix domain-containing protein [Paenibacillus sp. FSL H7-0331]|uniref:helix-turn-helix domain-containing protein n=1 Tax=Paenibacillus sp. FSL H7-0331 TaxID=1920421 RepID=UPI00096C6D35|nr:helix-turn-helix domain-containing protein [Paenibacillus sp. FSL H7-0331]OMF06088.1 hypothetical protein BK127_31615 [Paenibacillus sp. FSL H7-0331]